MPWFPVDDRFHSHPKAAAASLAAIGLWALAGSWANDHLTNGDVPEHMVRSLSRGATELADELVSVGLWRRTKTGYRFHQWQADSDGSVRNRSKSEVTAERKNKSIGGAIGNHRRWHTGKDGKPSSKCKYCHPDQEKQESVDRSDKRSDTEGGTDRTPNPPIPSHPIPTKDPPTPQGGKNGSRRSSNYDYDADPDFLRFWETYPRKTAKPKAYEAWKAARKRGTDAQVIIDAAARYRDNPDRKPNYTAHPATWLNGERYNDFDEVTSPSGGVDWWDA